MGDTPHSFHFRLRFDLLDFFQFQADIFKTNYVYFIVVFNNVISYGQDVDSSHLVYVLEVGNLSCLE